MLPDSCQLKPRPAIGAIAHTGCGAPPHGWLQNTGVLSKDLAKRVDSNAEKNKNKASPSTSEACSADTCISF